MLNKFSRPLLRSFATGANQRGSFELSYDIPPRYFLLNYEMNEKEFTESDEYTEHRQKIKDNISNQRIILNGETLAQN